MELSAVFWLLVQLYLNDYTTQMLATVWFIFLFFCLAVGSRPNIVIFIADDLGFNDVSWHNSQVLMPNLEKLAKSGIILEQHYSQP